MKTEETDLRQRLYDALVGDQDDVPVETLSMIDAIACWALNDRPLEDAVRTRFPDLTAALSKVAGELIAARVYDRQEVYDLVDEVRVERVEMANELLKNGWTLLGVNTTTHCEQQAAEFILGWQRQ